MSPLEAYSLVGAHRGVGFESPARRIIGVAIVIEAVPEVWRGINDGMAFVKDGIVDVLTPLPT